MKTFFLGFDLGSHSSKGVVIDEDGLALASESLEHKTQMPEPGWQEQNPEKWWEEFQQITKRLLDDSGVDPCLVKGVGITGFVPGLVMMDKDDKSIRPAIMHTDIRAGFQLGFINKTLGVEISHGFLMPKLLWIKDNEVKNYSLINKIVVPHGYIVKKLTGKFSCDPDTATIFGGVYDEASKTWSRENSAKLDINNDLLPDLYKADSVVGTIGDEAAKLTGLALGTSVITGTGDTFAALLGCGAVMRGDMMIYLGTSGTQLYIEGNLNDFIHGPHFGSGRAEFTGRIISCGDSLQRYRDILGFSDWKKLDQQALSTKPGADGLFVFPHLKQKDETEISKGDPETILGLENSHTPWHIYRAVMEGIAYNLKTSFIKQKLKVKRLILSGGGARSKVFREIISGVLNMDVYYNPAGDGAIGAALLAGYGVSGTDLKEKSLRISDNSMITKPDKDAAAIYKIQYKKYMKLRNTIEKLYVEQEIDEDD